MDKLIHIGKVEYLSLPNESIRRVPAKIDTGADISAIWASKISVKDNELSFYLFDKTSKYFTGKRIKVSDYEVKTIKNSFGHSENRYKVQFKTIVAGKTIRASFTLANRSKNRYPILVGRRTLHGKFVVDVTRKPNKPIKKIKVEK
ncbi:hypothetical protein EBZ57_03990 [bacterium]|nr:hypothetical protein [bacterium]